MSWFIQVTKKVSLSGLLFLQKSTDKIDAFSQNLPFSQGMSILPWQSEPDRAQLRAVLPFLSVSIDSRKEHI